MSKSLDNSLSKNNLIQKYLNEINCLSGLSDDEREKVALVYFNNKNHPLANTYRNSLIESHLKLAISIAKKYAKNCFLDQNKFLEFIQEANIGLIKAVEKFDPYKGIKFSTYATWWIKACIKAYILKNSYNFRFGKSAKEARLFWNIKKYIATRQKNQQDNIEISDKEIADKFGIEDKKDVKDSNGNVIKPGQKGHEFVADFRRAISSEFLTNDSSETHDFVDNLIDQALSVNLDLDEAFDYYHMQEKIIENKDDFFEKLSPKEKLVYQYRIDPKNEQKLSLRKVAPEIEKQLNISCSYEEVRLTQKNLEARLAKKYSDKNKNI